MIKINLCIICLFLITCCLVATNDSVSYNSPEDFKILLRLSDNNVRGNIADSGWVEYLWKSNFIIDSNELILGFYGSVIDGPYTGMDFVAFYDQSTHLIKYINIKDLEGPFFNWLGIEINDLNEESKIGLINQDLEYEDASSKYKKCLNLFHTHLKKMNLTNYDLYTSIKFQSLPTFLLLSNDKSLTRYFQTDIKKKMVKEINLDKFHFFDFMNTVEYKNQVCEKINVWGDVKKILVVSQTGSDILRLMNYQTGDTKIYDLKRMANFFQVFNVSSFNDAVGSGIDICVTSKNIYIILNGEKEKVVLVYKGKS